MEKIKFVVATRETQENFFTKTATGRSLALFNFLNIDIQLFPENKQGLPKVYNTIIDECNDDPCILIFAHDDIHILDYHWINRIEKLLDTFQVLGLAGNKKRTPYQPCWYLKHIEDNQFAYDDISNTSGIIGHGNDFFPESIENYGPPCQQVETLDGLFITCKSNTLNNNNIRFDEIFDFHFYDMDFCRQLEEKKIKMGTVDISVIHRSRGEINTPEWLNAMKKYFKKWND